MTIKDMNESTWKGFTNQYQVSKTLRFELKPVGKTAENIKNKGLLKKDEEKAEQYKKAKKIIDEYHKWFINKTLSGFSFESDDLENFKTAYDAQKNDKNNDVLKKELAKKQDSLRELVSKAFKTDSLFEKKFIEKKLPEWLEEHSIRLEGIDNPISIIEKFNKWTSYFGGFNENRKNIYTAEAHSTSIGYRLVHDNLPKFIDNIDRYEKAKKEDVDFSKVEKKFRVSLTEVFSLNYFNKCLTQEGIDRYNQIRGGQSQSNNKKEQGVNEVINLYAQQLESTKAAASDERKKELGKEIKNIRSCKLEELYKQILSDRSELSFRLQNIKSDGEVCKQIQHLFSSNEQGHLIGKLEIKDEDKKKSIEEKFNITEELGKVFKGIEEAEPSQLYIKNDRALTYISKHLFGDQSIITNSLEKYAEQKLFPKNNKTELKKSESWVKNTSYFSFEEIHKGLELYFEEYKEQKLDSETNDDKEDSKDKGMTQEVFSKVFDKSGEFQHPLFSYFKTLKCSKKNNETNKFEEVELLPQIKNTAKNAFTTLEEYKEEEGEELKNKKDHVEKIKDYLDAINDLLHFCKPLFVKPDKKEEKKADTYLKDNGFYDDFDKLYKVISQIIPLYNQTRNYLTKKPYSVEKYKLNFENSTLAAGWDKNKETDNTCVLLMKDGKYFLGVMHKEDSDSKKNSYNTLFEEKNIDPHKIEAQIESEREELKVKEGDFLKKKEGTKIYKKLKTKIEKLKESIKSREKSLEAIKYQSDYYRKMIYKQAGDVSKDIQNLMLIDGKTIRKIGKRGQYQDFIEKFPAFDTSQYEELPKKDDGTANYMLEKEKNDHLPENINSIRKKRSYLKYQDNFNKNDAIAFVDYYKARLDYWNFDFDFDLRNSEEYTDFNDFTDHLKQQTYQITFQNISTKHIEKCVEEGKLYLFEIYSKDFSQHSKGKPNLQTLYWKQLFSPENLEDVVYKLNGRAELFFRKASLSYSDDIWQTGHHYDKLKGKFDKNGKHLPIIKDRRYARDTYLFHASITCNFKSSGVFEFNDQVNKFLKNNQKINILGIDRGERHLAYYTLVNQQRKIIEQGSFNNPFGKKDYHELLDKREKERDKARKSWGTIEKIKDLKEGYLSQVVHKICQMIVKHNAIVVFEDLNFNFKKGRFKVEKQVYQKLEKMLIDKLNYLVFKDKKADETGGVLKALQLTAPFKSFAKMGKQTGIIFYVPAYHTSKICPATGFVNLLYTRYETVKKSQEFFGKFDSIRYNEEKDYFEFSFNYENFTKKAEGSKQEWTVCTYENRLENFKNKEKNNQWDTREIELTKELKELFKKYKIGFENEKNIKDDIKEQDKSQFFKDITRLLRLSLQMRNSRIGKDEDWIISTVVEDKNKNGNFFDSREIKDASMPQNADANGAYHIALKGLWCLRQLKTWEEGKENHKDEDDKKVKLHLSITNKEWYEFAQNNKSKNCAACDCGCTE